MAGRYYKDYRNLHSRLKTARGKAVSYLCVDCGGPAREWSYNHSGIDEFVTIRDHGRAALRYSTDLWQYDPRCRKCHLTFDVRNGGF